MIINVSRQCVHASGYRRLGQRPNITTHITTHIATLEALLVLEKSKVG